MRIEVAQLWGRKASTEVSRCSTNPKNKTHKTPNGKKKTKPKIILERLQKGRADPALLEKRSAESTSVNTFSGSLRVPACLARQLVRDNEQGLICAGLCRHPAHLLEDEPSLSQLPSTSLMVATIPPPAAPLWGRKGNCARTSNPFKGMPKFYHQPLKPNINII